MSPRGTTLGPSGRLGLVLAIGTIAYGLAGQVLAALTFGGGLSVAMLTTMRLITDGRALDPLPLYGLGAVPAFLVIWGVGMAKSMPSRDRNAFSKILSRAPRRFKVACGAALLLFILEAAILLGLGGIGNKGLYIQSGHYFIAQADGLPSTPITLSDFLRQVSYQLGYLSAMALVTGTGLVAVIAGRPRTSS